MKNIFLISIFLFSVSANSQEKNGFTLDSLMSQFQSKLDYYDVGDSAITTYKHIDIRKWSDKILLRRERDYFKGNYFTNPYVHNSNTVEPEYTHGGRWYLAGELEDKIKGLEKRNFNAYEEFVLKVLPEYYTAYSKKYSWRMPFRIGFKQINFDFVTGEDIRTSAIAHSPMEDDVRIIINIDNWESLNNIERVWLLTHELAHEAYGIKHAENELMYPIIPYELKDETIETFGDGYKELTYPSFRFPSNYLRIIKETCHTLKYELEYDEAWPYRAETDRRCYDVIRKNTYQEKVSKNFNVFFNAIVEFYDYIGENAHSENPIFTYNEFCENTGPFSEKRTGEFYYTLYSKYNLHKLKKTNPEYRGKGNFYKHENDIYTEEQILRYAKEVGISLKEYLETYNVRHHDINEPEFIFSETETSFPFKNTWYPYKTGPWPEDFFSTRDDISEDDFTENYFPVFDEGEWVNTNLSNYDYHYYPYLPQIDCESLPNAEKIQECLEGDRRKNWEEKNSEYLKKKKEFEETYPEDIREIILELTRDGRLHIDLLYFKHDTINLIAKRVEKRTKRTNHPTYNTVYEYFGKNGYGKNTINKWKNVNGQPICDFGEDCISKPNNWSCVNTNVTYHNFSLENRLYNRNYWYSYLFDRVREWWQTKFLEGMRFNEAGEMVKDVFNFTRYDSPNCRRDILLCL